MAAPRLLSTAPEGRPADALAIWNTVVPNFFTFDITAHNPCDPGDAFNAVGFAPDHCGDGFGDVIAFTRKTYVQRAERFVITQADVVLNAQLCWDAYAGPLQLCKGTLGYAIYDINRPCDAELMTQLRAVPNTIAVRAAGC